MARSYVSIGVHPGLGSAGIDLQQGPHASQANANATVEATVAGPGPRESVPPLALPVGSSATASPAPPFAALSAAYLGLFVSGFGTQMMTSGLADIQGATGTSADEASWITTVPSMVQLALVPVASTLFAAFGAKRFLGAALLAFAVAAAVAIATPSLTSEVTLRGCQGALAALLGAAAFGLTFQVFGPLKRLPLGLSLLIALQLAPAAVAPFAAGVLIDRFGWEIIYQIQIIGCLTACALVERLVACRPFDSKPLAGLDWLGFGLLSPALALLVLALAQGDRRFWLESPMIALSLAGAAMLLLVFALVERKRPTPLLNFGLALTAGFGGAAFVNIALRLGLLETGFLAPQFLTRFQGYRTLESGAALLPALLVQVAAFVLVYRLMLAGVRARYLVLSGLGLSILSLAIGSQRFTSSAASGEFLLAALTMGAAPVLILVPALVSGVRDVRPQDGPSAATFFNASTVLGQQAATALLASTIRAREAHHSANLIDRLPNGSAEQQARLDILQAIYAQLISDDGAATAAASMHLARSVQAQAYALAFNDTFLMAAIVLSFAFVIAAFVLGAAERKAR
jgi:MFS transporter, DHA2 family, multidrug resistance protein